MIVIDPNHVASLIYTACGGPAGIAKSHPLYDAITEHRDAPCNRKWYSSCGDLPNWLLWASGVPGANHGASFIRGANISALAGHHLAITPSATWQPSIGDICLLWNLASTADAHAIVICGAGPTPAFSTGNYGAAGMSAADFPGGKVVSKSLTRTLGVWRYGLKIVRRVIPFAAWSAAATKIPELP